MLILITVIVPGVIAYCGRVPCFDTDRVLTLSTCFRGDSRQRYLVQGILVKEIPGK